MNAAIWHQFFFVVAVMFKRDKLNVDIRDRTIIIIKCTFI